jgi:hypothetical protein
MRLDCGQYPTKNSTYVDHHVQRTLETRLHRERVAKLNGLVSGNGVQNGHHFYALLSIICSKYGLGFIWLKTNMAGIAIWNPDIMCVQNQPFEYWTTVRIWYPDKFGYQIAFLAYNRIFDIRTTKRCGPYSISGPDIEYIQYPDRISVILGTKWWPFCFYDLITGHICPDIKAL